jgi:hypothetical protein
VAGELVASLLKNLLEAVTRVLKAALQRSGTDMQLSGNVHHLGTPPYKLSLDSAANTLRKGLLTSMLLQLLIELRRENSQQLGIVGFER